MDHALGTRLRTLLDRLDGDVASVYPRLGLHDYRPRYSPLIRALAAGERCPSATWPEPSA